MSPQCSSWANGLKLAVSRWARKAPTSTRTWGWPWNLWPACPMSSTGSGPVQLNQVLRINLLAHLLRITAQAAIRYQSGFGLMLRGVHRPVLLLALLGWRMVMSDPWGWWLLPGPRHSAGGMPVRTARTSADNRLLKALRDSHTTVREAAMKTDPSVNAPTSGCRVAALTIGETSRSGDFLRRRSRRGSCSCPAGE